MTIHYLCPQCGALSEKVGLCPDCKRADNRRRNEKRRTSGRTTAAWQRLRLAALHRDNFTCQREGCDVAGIAKTMTVHLRPALGGNHFAATLADLTTYCRSCHGSVDAPRSQHTPHAEPTYSEPSVG